MVQIDSALGEPYKTIGEVINSLGIEDSSGLRRTIIKFLMKPDRDTIKLLLPGVTNGDINKMRNACVDSWGEPPEK